jgi:hypothetical protein
MSDNKQYSIIREQGEFMDPVQLNEKDNETVNARDDSSSNTDDNR